jgi:hypothetical protein
MERRREPRFSAETPALVTLLGSEQERLEGRVVNASGRGLRLLLNGYILLGEVCYSTPEGSEYAVGLALEQALAELTELARMVDSLLRQDALPVRLGK